MSCFRFFAVLLVLCACGKALPEFNNMDIKAWADDKNACKGNRASMLTVFEKQKDKLLGLNQMEIVSLLGRPDENELYKRNQKFFYYYIKPATVCSITSDSAKARLIIRFNAVGLAKEVFIE